MPFPDLSEREIKGILARASKRLQKDSSHNRDDDVGCNVTFTFKGSVGTFASPDTPVVDRDNLAAVHRVHSNVADVDFHVKVVKGINFCEGVSNDV
jgi:hypothetical protein